MSIHSYLTKFTKHYIKLLFLLSIFMGFVAVSHAQTMVDKKIVMVIDTSSSMSAERYQWVMDGYYSALKDQTVQASIDNGHYGKIAISVVQFDSGAYIIHDWIVVDKTNIDDYAETFKEQKRVGSGTTNYNAGLLMAKNLIVNNKVDAVQTIIVFCADGTITEGGPSFPLNSIISKNLKTTIIGVSLWTMTTEKLNLYLKKMIVSGEGGFVSVVKRTDDFRNLMIDILSLNN